MEVRPFDPEAFEPFTRAGLRIVLLIVAMPMAGFSILHVLVDAPPHTFLGYFAFNVLLATLCVALPTYAIAARIRGWKSEELSSVARAIEGDRSALGNSRFSKDLEQLDFPGLLAYRREIEALRISPFDRGHLARFVFYVVLPPLSWVAAALVEQLVDRVLG